MTELALSPAAGVDAAAATTTELLPPASALGELVDPGSLAALAEEIARRQPAPLTREAYAGVYRAYSRFAGAGAGPDALNPERVRAYRDQLERAGRSQATIAKHLSALRTLAGALGVEGVRDVRGAKVARGEPRALTRRGVRAAAADARPAHHRRANATSRCCTCSAPPACAAPRPAPSSSATSTSAAAQTTPGCAALSPTPPPGGSPSATANAAAAATSRSSRTPSTRSPPGPAPGPTCGFEELLVSLPTAQRPSRPLTVRDATRIVARYGELAGLPDDRRTPHVLRHTFCTHLADGGTSIDVIRELAGHADIRTTTIYSAVADQRLEEAVDDAARRRRGLGRLGA